jgi:type IV secretory pathway TraG/TraD family ATPase VirD4
MIDLIVRGSATMRGGKNASGENPFRGSAMRATSFLDSLGLAEICADNENAQGVSFTCQEIKRDGACCFMVAPLTAIQSAYAPFVRALSCMMAHVFQNMPGESAGTPAVIILDEAPSLGRLPQLLETGSVGFRKYNLRLIACFQDLPAISAKAAYPDTWETVLGNAFCTLWMGVTDLRTKRYVSDVLGRATRREKVEGAHLVFRLLGLSNIKPRYQNFERLLMDPERVGDHTTPSRGMLICTGKERPFTAAIEPYWKSLPVWRYAPDPSHPETLSRRFTRWLIGAVKERRARAERLKTAEAKG